MAAGATANIRRIRCSIRAVCCAAVCVAVAAPSQAQTNATTAAAAEPPPPATNPLYGDGVTPKAGPLLALLLKPLLAQVGARLAKAAGDKLADNVGDLFGRAAGAGSRKKADAGAAPDAPLVVPGADNGISAGGTGNTGSVVPAIVYAVDRLDAVRFEKTGALDVGDATRGRPTLKTGDVFALRYATNLPGQVRIENVDARGVRTALGTYNVLPGQDNRIPRTRGIQLAGSTGEETFNLYFYPCLPAEATTLVGYASYRDSLPACSAGSAPEPALMVASADPAPGALRTRGAVNLELDDPSIVVAAAVGFKPRDVVQQSFKLLHEPR